ncbi:hypothetical protein C8R43DRAFT_901268, partial [Mycena crocata]
MANPTQFLLPEEQRFNGLNFTDFELVFKTGVEGRGFAGYLDGSIQKPTRTAAQTATQLIAAATAAGTNFTYLEPSTPVHSINPFLEEFVVRSQWLKSTLLNNIVGPRALGLKTDRSPKEMWDWATA